MKKGWTIINLIFIMTILLACDKAVQKDVSRFYAMDTFIEVNLTYSELDDNQKHFDAIEDIYRTYESISDNFIPYNGVNNIYYINQQADLSEVSTTVEITKELYELLMYAYDFQLKSNGYFDITIGKIIDVWKLLINEYATEPFMEDNIVPDEVIEGVLKKVDAIEIVENPLSFSIIDNKYYVTVKKGVKIDLGAIAKGYATQKVVEYFNEQKIFKYYLSAGSSSLILGYKNDQNPDYVIGLKNPLYETDPQNQKTTFGRVTASNTSITTSGSNVQKVIGTDGTWYHHIISPITRRPVNLYYSISLIGPDAALLDGYSTALFSMNIDDIEKFLENSNVELIAYLNDETIKVINETGRFTSTVTKP